MKRERETSARRLLFALAAMAALTAIVFFVLPRVLPYEKMNALYGLGRPKTMEPIYTLPAGEGAQEVVLMMDGLHNVPESYLLVNGERYMQIGKLETDGRKTILFDAGLLEAPGELKLSIEFCFNPLLKLKTNVVTVPVQ